MAANDGSSGGWLCEKIQIFFVPNELKSQKKQHPNFSFYLNLGVGWVKHKYGYYIFLTLRPLVLTSLFVGLNRPNLSLEFFKSNTPVKSLNLCYHVSDHRSLPTFL